MILLQCYSCDVQYFVIAVSRRRPYCFKTDRIITKLSKCK